MWQIPLWLYAAVMAAGTGAQYMGQKKVDSERAKAMAEERDRRMKLSRENEASADQSKQLFADTQARETARAGQLEQDLKVQQPTATVAPLGDRRLLDALAPGTSSRTVETTNDRLARNQGRLDQRAKSLGQLGAFSSLMGSNTQGLQRNAQDIDMNSSSMRNWNQNVLPARLEYANQSGRDWSTTGDVLKLAASIMAPFALGGGGANAAGGASQEINAARFGDFASKGFGGISGGSIPFGSSFGVDALAQAGANGIVADDRLNELLALQQLGHRLSVEDLEYIKSHNYPGMMH